eukprot:m.144652 g.144652  ORF g.144652 m.144652 type:complete len:97 (+) comp16047_c3_seq3:1923-2213(+)
MPDVEYTISFTSKAFIQLDHNTLRVWMSKQKTTNPLHKGVNVMRQLRSIWTRDPAGLERTSRAIFSTLQSVKRGKEHLLSFAMSYTSHGYVVIHVK